MPLIPCPECGRQISTAAEACPQCGHPQAKQAQSTAPPEKDPFDFSSSSGSSSPLKCYCCCSAATTRCMNCGILSCAVHVQPITIMRGDDRSRELRCQACYDQAKKMQKIGCIIMAIVGTIILLSVFGSWLSMIRWW